MPFELATEEFIHMQDKLLVRAVVFSSSFRRDVVGRLERDRVFRLQGNRGARTLAGGGTTTPRKKPDYFVDEAINSNMDLVPNPPELARGQKADGTPNISEKQAEFFHFLDINTNAGLLTNKADKGPAGRQVQNRLPGMINAYECSFARVENLRARLQKSS